MFSIFWSDIQSDGVVVVQIGVKLSQMLKFFEKEFKF